ncbi:MAG TPA: hypothetical protein DEG71_02520 [Clostridiales bacterium]|nr:hypothetical protein [Clostridiales bacterium]
MMLKLKILFLFCLIFTVKIIAQNDSSIIKDSPFTFELTYTGDAANNFDGGIKRGSCYLGMVNITLLFSTEKAKLWKGGEFLIKGANTHGATPSATFIGDFQGISNIEAGDLTYFHELWFKQNIRNLIFTIGLQDLNAEFISSEYTSLFLNGSFGTHSTIADNVPSPVFPLTALGAQMQYNLSDKFSAKVSVFDGFPDDFEDNPYNINWSLKKDDGLLTFGELTISDIFSKFSGDYKLGGYYHNHIPSISNELNSMEITYNYGIYFIVDQEIYKNNKGKHLSTFIQASISPNQKNENWYYIGAGINYQGLFPKRLDDIFGIAIAYAGFENKYYKSETSIEMTYKAKISDNVFIQPDLQYVINPSGTDKKIDNAFVGLLRFGLNF